MTNNDYLANSNMPSENNYNTIISAKQLAELMNAAEAPSTLRIFDCRHSLSDDNYGKKAFAAAHITGALFIHLDRDLSGTKTGKNGRHPLPEVSTFAALLSRCGVAAKTQVVAYDDEGGIFAARLWWMLRWLGHERVAVFDGGLKAWKREGLPQNNRVVRYPAAQFIAKENPQICVDADFVLRHLHKPEQMLLLDARQAERFMGVDETLDPVGGHIPGAAHRYFMQNLDAEGVYFKTSAELQQDFAALGVCDVSAAKKVVQQCGSGVSACHNLLAMEVAKLCGSRLYAGSWSEWCSNGARPMVTIKT